MQPSAGKKVLVSIIVLLVMAGLGLLAYFLARRHFTPPAPQAAPAMSIPDAGPAADAGHPPAALPPAEAPEPVRPDDEGIRRSAAALTDDREFAKWLGAEHLLGKFVAVVEMISRGESPAKLLPFMEPEGKFAVIERDEKEVIDPRSYRRYDPVAQAFASLDARKVAKLIDRLSPYLEAKYREMAKPGENFRSALTRAMIELLRVPAIEEEIPLERISVTLKIGVPELEAMSPAQKHLFRMGPVNITRVQAKLREIGRALGLFEKLDPVRPIAVKIDKPPTETGK